VPVYKAMSPAVEVNGETVLSVVAGMGSFGPHALKILAAAGIESPTAGHWYKQQAWLDAFEKIAQSIGDRTLHQIGLQIPQSAKFPPQIDSLDKALASIDTAYHMNHRGGPIGSYTWRSSGKSSGVMVCQNPYPCDFDRGIVEATTKRFKPAGAIVQVVHEGAQPCRKKGGNSCTFTVSW